jgi:uncharacterized repeat protein (TIGR01451 family)
MAAQLTMVRRVLRTMRPAPLLIALALLLALPATSPAAFSLGQTTDANLGCPDASLAQVGAAAPRYAVESFGVITELRTEDQNAGMRLHVFRPRGGNAYEVLGTAEVSASSNGVIRMPARIRVVPGDVLGMSGGGNCLVPGAGTADRIASSGTEVPDAGEPTLANASQGRLNVAATLEPDADGDGFGDETQDRCPGDASRTTQECSADLALAQTPVERDMEREDVNVLVITVRNNGPSPSNAVRIVEPLPNGVQLVTATPSSGGCAGGGTLDCTLPTIGAGATGTVLVVVRAVTVGQKELTATASSPTPDPNPNNNADGAAFDVSQRRTTVSPGAFCRVPRLTGLSRTSARRALEAAGCRLGRTLRAGRSRLRMRVRRQTIPAGTRVIVRTSVGITLRSAVSRRRR